MAGFIPFFIILVIFIALGAIGSSVSSKKNVKSSRPAFPHYPYEKTVSPPPPVANEAQKTSLQAAYTTTLTPSVAPVHEDMCALDDISSHKETADYSERAALISGLFATPQDSLKAVIYSEIMTPKFRR